MGADGCNVGRARAGVAVGIGRIRARNHLVTVERVVAVAIDAQATRGAQRHQRVRGLVAAGGACKERFLRERFAGAVAHEAAGLEHPAALHAVAIALGNERHLRGLVGGDGDQLADARGIVAGAACVGGGDLLSDAGMRVDAPAQDQRFHVAALGIAGEAEAHVQDVLQRELVAAMVEAAAAVVVGGRLAGADLAVGIAQRGVLAVLHVAGAGDVHHVVGAVGADGAVAGEAAEARRRAEDLRGPDGLRVHGVAGSAHAHRGVARDGHGRLQRVVDAAVWVRAEGERGHVLLHAGHLGGGELAVAALQGDEGLVELGDVVLLAAPVERAEALRDAEEGLRGHRPLHRVPGGAARHLAALVEELHGALRVAQVPRHAVRPAVDVAGGAARLPKARGEVRVEDELAAVLHRGGRGVVQRDARDLAVGARADGGDRALEAVEDVEAAAIGGHHQAGGAFAHGDGGNARARRAEGDHVVGAEAAGPCGGAVRAEGHAARIAHRLQAVEDARAGGRVGEVRVDVDHAARAGAAGEARGQALHEHAVHVLLEAQLVVARFHADGHHVAAGGGADAADGGHQSLDVGDRVGGRVDHGHVVVMLVPGDEVGPVAAVAVEPLVGGGVLSDDLAHARCGAVGGALGRAERGAGVRRRVHACVGAVGLADGGEGQAGGVVPRLEDGQVDLGAVRAGGQRARAAAGDGHVGDGAGRGRIHDRHLLRHRERDERLLGRTGEDHVRGLVAHEDGLAHAHRGQVDDAHRVGDLVDHPRLGVAVRADGDRVEAHRHGAALGGDAADHVEDFQARIGRVHRQEHLSVRGQVDRVALRGFPVDEGSALRNGWQGRGEGHQGDECVSRGHVTNHWGSSDFGDGAGRQSAKNPFHGEDGPEPGFRKAARA